MSGSMVSISVSPQHDVGLNAGLWSESLVMATSNELVGVSESTTSSVEQSSLTDISQRIRALTLSIPIYEQLLRDGERLIADLVVQQDRDEAIKAEYQADVEFLRQGLAQAIERLAQEHGVHWSSDAVEVYRAQRTFVEISDAGIDSERGQPSVAYWDDLVVRPDSRDQIGVINDRVYLDQQVHGRREANREAPVRVETHSAP